METHEFYVDMCCISHSRNVSKGIYMTYAPAVTYGQWLWLVNLALEGTVALNVRLPDLSHNLIGRSCMEQGFRSLVKWPCSPHPNYFDLKND
jgi:hypothetical protein